VICVECGTDFAGRADGRYCSAACKQRAYRTRVTATPPVTATDEPGLFDLEIAPEVIEPELVEEPTLCSTPGCRVMTPNRDGRCNFCRVGLPL
jgi:hypothetical protein